MHRSSAALRRVFRPSHESHSLLSSFGPHMGVIAYCLPSFGPHVGVIAYCLPSFGPHVGVIAYCLLSALTWSFYVIVTTYSLLLEPHVVPSSGSHGSHNLLSSISPHTVSSHGSHDLVFSPSPHMVSSHGSHDLVSSPDPHVTLSCRSYNLLSSWPSHDLYKRESQPTLLSVIMWFITHHVAFLKKPHAGHNLLFFFFYNYNTMHVSINFSIS